MTYADYQCSECGGDRRINPSPNPPPSKVTLECWAGCMNNVHTPSEPKEFTLIGFVETPDPQEDADEDSEI